MDGMRLKKGGFVNVTESKFNQGFELFQVFYNAVIGAEFGLPKGALNENVEIKVNLEAFKNVTLAQIQTNPESMFATFFNTLTVIGATSGVFNAGNPLILNGGLEAYLKVPVPNIQALAAGFGVPYDDLVALIMI